MTGALLPNSRLTRLVGADARRPWPTSREPVKLTIATPGWMGSAGATSSVQVTTVSHPGGRPASSNSDASARAVSGVAGDGLRTTGQPTATAGATLWHTRFSGKLNGVMAPTTPTGTRRTKPTLPSPAALASRGRT